MAQPAVCVKSKVSSHLFECGTNAVVKKGVPLCHLYRTRGRHLSRGVFTLGSIPLSVPLLRPVSPVHFDIVGGFSRSLILFSIQESNNSGYYERFGRAVFSWLKNRQIR